MNSIPLVSVIIATFNRADFISRCLDSVLGQTHTNIEIIVVDDCSTDNTAEVLDSYSDRITVMRNTKNMGIAFNSNLGFSASNGQYICLLGDDDYWTDNRKVEDQLTVFSERGDVGLSSSWWIEFDKNTGYELKRTPVYPADLKERVLSGGGLICGSAVMLSREAWEKVGGFDENKRRGTDSDLFRRIVLEGYDIDIIESFMVSVDVTKGRTRMTDLASSERIQTHIDSLLLTLDKHKKEYDNYPKAKAIYYEKLGWLYEQKYKYLNEGASKSIFYYFYSIRVNPGRIKNVLRLVRISFIMLRRSVGFK